MKTRVNILGVLWLFLGRLLSCINLKIVMMQLFVGIIEKIFNLNFLVLLVTDYNFYLNFFKNETK